MMDPNEAGKDYEAYCYNCRKHIIKKGRYFKKEYVRKLGDKRTDYATRVVNDYAIVAKCPFCGEKAIIDGYQAQILFPPNPKNFSKEKLISEVGNYYQNISMKIINKLSKDELISMFKVRRGPFDKKSELSNRLLKKYKGREITG